ncbi:MAG: hypothetical protein WC708_21370 [Lentisphaeria bacterium]
MNPATRSVSGLAVATLALLLPAAVSAANINNTLNITTGTAITRTWADVQTASYAYGAKQSYSISGSTTTTHIWMPYGDTNGVYYDLQWVTLTNPSGGQVGLVANNNATHNCLYAFKLHFDQPVSSFTIYQGASSWNLTSSTTDVIGGGFFYSPDGSSWTAGWSGSSAANPGWVEPLLNNYQVTGLNTQDLYLAFSTYDITDPANTVDSNTARYLQLRTAGAPSWGENYFFTNQLQLEVTTPEPAALAVLALGGLLTVPTHRRRVQ